MKKIRFYRYLVIPVLIVLSACSSPAVEPTATATEKPTATNKPTSAPLPTNTSEATLSDLFEMDSRYFVEEGGFSFISFFGMGNEINGSSAIVYAYDNSFYITLAGDEPNEDDPPPLEMFEIMVRDQFSDLPEDVKQREPFPVTVASYDGYGLEFKWKNNDQDIKGTVILLTPDDDHYIFCALYAKLDPDENLRDSEAYESFERVIGSVEFIDWNETSADTCLVSTDDSYGYTKDNPVRVGGGAFGGPQNEIAYLESLTGPEGQAVTYNRFGSVGSNETILDAYEVSYEGSQQTVIIYIDEYSFDTLYAPVGFGCWRAFPFTGETE